MRKYTGILFVLLLVIGCGGGGGSDNSGANPNPNPPATPQEAAQQILEGCAAVNLEEILDFFELFSSVFDTQGSIPDFVVTGIDIFAGVLFWELDVDSDGQPDLNGSVGFLDDQGSAAPPPFNLNQLIGGLDNIATLLAQLPDGWSVIIGYIVPSPDLTIDGGIVVSFLNGEPDEASGNANIIDPLGCSMLIEFDGLDALDLLDQFPIGELRLLLTADQGELIGTITFDGSNIAVLDVELDGTHQFTFELNLLTGVVTPVP